MPLAEGDAAPVTAHRHEVRVGKGERLHGQILDRFEVAVHGRRPQRGHGPLDGPECTQMAVVGESPGV